MHTKRAVIAALSANCIIAVTKFAAALSIGSAALLAEGFHSLADTANQAFLLIGIRLSKKPPDRSHPFGHARERYLWAFVVSMSIFVIGALFSIQEGIHKIRHPEPLRHAEWGLLVIAIAFMCESYSWRVAFGQLQPSFKRRGIFKALRASKAPALFIIFMEDSAAILGLFIALSGLLIAWLSGNTTFDGFASILIGCILAAIAILLFIETKSLLIGEGVSTADLRKIKEAIASIPEVKETIDILTMHLGPDEVLVNVDINFADGLSTDQLEAAIDKVEQAIRRALPSVKRIFVEAESPYREKEK